MADTVKLEVRLVPDTKELEKVLKQYQGQKIEIESTLPKEYRGQAGLNISKALNKVLPVAAISAGVTTLKKVLDSINTYIKDMRNQMMKINPALEGQTELLNKVLNLALLPMSQVMVQLMRPYLLLMLLQIRRQMQLSAPILKQLQAGEITPEEAEKRLIPIFQETSTILSQYNKELKEKTKSIEGSMSGYQKGLDLVNNTYLSGTKEFITSLNLVLMPKLDALLNPAKEMGIVSNPIISAFSNMYKNPQNSLFGNLGNFVKGLFGLHDFIVSNNTVYSIDPKDTIVGFKDKSSFRRDVVVNLHVDGFLDDTTITTIANKIRYEVQRGVGI